MAVGLVRCSGATSALAVNQRASRLSSVSRIWFWRLMDQTHSPAIRPSFTSITLCPATVTRCPDSAGSGPTCSPSQAGPVCVHPHPPVHDNDLSFGGDLARGEVEIRDGFPQLRHKRQGLLASPAGLIGCALEHQVRASELFNDIRVAALAPERVEPTAGNLPCFLLKLSSTT